MTPPHRRAVPIRALFLLVVVALLLGSHGAAGRAAAPVPNTGAAQVTSAEQQLADKFAPVAYLKTEPAPCDDTGEPYVPANVDVIFNNPDVALKRNGGSDSSDDDPVIKMAPTAQDLAGLDDTYYLDFPGNPRDPGCTYEQWSKALMADKPSVTYAHIAVNPDGSGVVLQYWFYYIFNRFNNTHESDWEMIQLNFDGAGSVEAALAMEPTSLAYAQHGGAEAGYIGDAKLGIEDGHPVIYPAAGSHATQYESETYIGWGSNGTGFGCDVTTGPSTRTPLQAIVIPQQIDPSGPFAWLLFEGRWGQKEPWEYNGPTGPQLGKKWNEPFTWTNDIRESSLAIPTSDLLGPSPTNLFCTLSEAGSKVLTIFGVHPLAVKMLLLGLLILIVVLFIITRKRIGPALRLYRDNWKTLTVIGLSAIPIGIILNGFQYLITTNPPVAWILSWVGDTDAARLFFAFLTGIVQLLLMLVIAGPAVMEVIRQSRRGEKPTVRDAYRVSLARFRQLARSLLRAAAIVVGLWITVIGIPWAIWKGVRWSFFGQATMLDDASDAKDALRVSAASVDGRWWKVTGVGVVFLLIGALPGPLIGILLLIIGGKSVQFVNGVSSLIYALTIPYALTGLTLLYLERRKQTPRDRDGTAAPIDG